MALIMEPKILNNEINSSFILEQISHQQLIELAVNSYDESIGLQTRQELIKRGKDSIPNRIQIKKCGRSILENFEAVLKTLDTNSTNENTKAYKTRFLNLLSILDKLQLEWQRHDLGLSK